VSAKKGLGRGFSSLIPTELLDESFDPTADQDEKVSELRQIKLTEIIADPEQPRRSFDEDALMEMADSIRHHGILQPIVVTPKSGAYVIVAGERRFRASKIAGLDKIPAIVRTLSNQHKLELSLIENLQRRDLNALETATAYLKLRDQFNLTLDEIGRRVGGKSVSAISNTMRLLRLPDTVQKAIVEGKLSEGQARPLINLDRKLVEEMLPQILKEEWSSRRIEQFIVQVKKAGQSPAKAIKEKITDAPYKKDTARLMKRFSTDVSVKTNAKGAGQIVIRFKNDDEFQRIQKLLS
jgi:ParB family chromosome partitioning protein